MKSTYLTAALAIVLGARLISAANSTNTAGDRSSPLGLKALPGGQEAVVTGEQGGQALKPLPGSAVAVASLQPLKPLPGSEIANTGLQSLSAITIASQLATTTAAIAQLTTTAVRVISVTLTKPMLTTNRLLPRKHRLRY